MATYSITLTFDVEGPHMFEDIQLIADQAGFQVEDPRDDDGGYVAFATSNLHVVVAEDEWHPELD